MDRGGPVAKQRGINVTMSQMLSSTGQEIRCHMLLNIMLKVSITTLTPTRLTLYTSQQNKTHTHFRRAKYFRSSNYLQVLFIHLHSTLKEFLTERTHAHRGHATVFHVINEFQKRYLNTANTRRALIVCCHTKMVHTTNTTENICNYMTGHNQPNTKSRRHF
jgi:hypothetical protein